MMSVEPTPHGPLTHPKPLTPLEELEILHEAQPEEGLINHLERDQLVSETFRPVPPARLGQSTVIGLWVLRVFVVLVSAMVVYTFIARLH
jgi:hypothetical protein